VDYREDGSLKKPDFKSSTFGKVKNIANNNPEGKISL